MTFQPKVSIIIVTYNAEKYLQNCIDCINVQTNKDFEILIQDGKSSDRTLDIIKENELSIRYWNSEVDLGIYDAMNKAVLKSRGTWILFLGADDSLLPEFSSMIPNLTHPNTLYYGHAIMDGNKFGRKTNKYRLAKANLCHQAVFYPKIVFDLYSYDIRYKVYADYLLNMQCWSNKSIKKKYFPLAIANYTSNGFSSYAQDHEFMQRKSFFVRQYLGNFTYWRYWWKKRRKMKEQGNKFF